MSNITVNAPVQNTNFCPDEQFGKVIPLFASQLLQGIDPSGHIDPHVELWNNVLASEQAGYDSLSYAQLTKDRLQEKYDSMLLQRLHGRDSRTAVLTDTDPDFLSWAAREITVAVDNDDMRIRKIGIYMCGLCEAALAVSEGPKPQNCSTCPEDTAIVDTEREILTAQFSQTSRQSVDKATGTVSNTDNSGKIFIVNKRRVNGISLEGLGFPLDAVDPRIGLGLLATYAAAQSGADTVRVVASRKTVRQNLEHYFAATLSQQPDLPQIQMVGIAKAPADYLRYIRDEGLVDTAQLAEHLKRRIVPRLISMRRDMTPQYAEQLIFSKRNSANIDKLDL